MKRVEALIRFVWDFVVGDDWVTAAGVVIAIALTALLSHAGVTAWALMPLGVGLLLALSVWRPARAARRPPPSS